jgi:beta-phosphoglucomutase-like phosphatase (HAD superfamily)
MVSTNMALGLPDGIRGCLFDLDGVLTKTAAVHDAAWKEMFDSYLGERARQTGQPFVPFDPAADYEEYVDGKPRAEGTRSFLAARGITLPDGSDDDPPEAAAAHSVWRRPRRRSSRMRWPAWRPAGPASSAA